MLVSLLLVEEDMGRELEFIDSFCERFTLRNIPRRTCSGGVVEAVITGNV
jgi:hypothetical protein